MRLSPATKLRATVALLACTLLRAHPLQAQQPDTVSIQTTTQERLDSEPWWPTKSTLPLNTFAGSAACVRCHKDEASTTPMQRAAVTAADATFLKARPAQSFSSRPFTYSLASTPTGIDYTVADGPHRLSRKLDWVMGAGLMGRTFLYQIDGQWYQSQLTYYTALSALDITTGLPPDISNAPATHLTSALGQPLSPDDTRRCFNCHTVHSTTSQGFNPLHAEAGLGCEACHGPGLAHATQMSANPGPHPNLSNIFNPAKLSPVDSNDFCGACHRSFADASQSIAQVQASSTAIVRFQPYRLEESRCWRESLQTQGAQEVTCVACHNPHQPLDKNLASYDKHCLQCHSGSTSTTTHSANVCPKATSQCVTCHMPKVNVPSMHGDFTDHYIRVVHPNEGFPQ
jgi:hypothetical protein